MSVEPIRVLFVCTGNSARSLMAEALLRQLGGPAFDVSSAGTDPRGVNPLTIAALKAAGIDAGGLHSTSVNEYLDERFDYVVTVCDRARESCPVFPAEHRSLHWDFDDPAQATGTDEERLAVFELVMAEIADRVRAFIPPAIADQGRTPRDATPT